jgi:hypothetical protein
MPILIPRGFLSSNDPELFYFVLADSKGHIKQTLLHCLCGNNFPIEPIDGKYEWKHRMCLVGTLELEGFADIKLTKKEKKAKWKSSE